MAYYLANMNLMIYEVQLLAVRIVFSFIYTAFLLAYVGPSVCSDESCILVYHILLKYLLLWLGRHAYEAVGSVEIFMNLS